MMNAHPVCIPVNDHELQDNQHASKPGMQQDTHRKIPRPMLVVVPQQLFALRRMSIRPGTRVQMTHPAEHVVQPLQRALLHDPRVRLIRRIRDRVVRQVLCAVVSRSLDSSQSSRAYTHVDRDGRVDEQPGEHPAQLPAREPRDPRRRERLQEQWARRNDAREHCECVLVRGRCRARPERQYHSPALRSTPVRVSGPCLAAAEAQVGDAPSNGP